MLGTKNKVRKGSGKKLMMERRCVGKKERRAGRFARRSRFEIKQKMRFGLILAILLLGVLPTIKSKSEQTEDINHHTGTRLDNRQTDKARNQAENEVSVDIGLGEKKRQRRVLQFKFFQRTTPKGFRFPLIMQIVTFIALLAVIFISALLAFLWCRNAAGPPRLNDLSYNTLRVRTMAAPVTPVVYAQPSFANASVVNPALANVY